MTSEGALVYDFCLLVCTLCSTGLLLYANYLIYYENVKKALWIVYPAFLFHGLLFIMEGIVADEFQYFASTLSLFHVLFAFLLWILAHILVLAEWIKKTKPR